MESTEPAPSPAELPKPIEPAEPAANPKSTPPVTETAAAPPVSPPPASNTQSASPPTPAQSPPPGNVGPASADDVDVIEKEWVDAAETVVRATKDDPHREEEAVENLQIDYLKKRYGKDVEKSED